MRPYLAIIIDSFRAAFSSRILYVLLGLIVLLLLALAPLHIRESLDWKIQFVKHASNPKLLAEQMVERGKSDQYPEVQRIWSKLSVKTRETLESFASTDEPTDDNDRQRRQDLNRYFEFINELNEIISDPSFYRPEDWTNRTLDKEAQSLIKEGPATLSKERYRRLNRLLVGAALPSLENGAPTTISVYYATFSSDSFSFSATREEVAANTSQITSYIFDKIVMSIGLLIGILVTANIIPDTFDPGSLNLLLSKPISRWGLFLTKFIGGCILIALCSVLLFAGTWLWMGLGIGVWDPAFLWSIPLYILVFAIYYSVSAFIGLTYRSAIMAVVVTGLFWATCFAVGSGYGYLNARMQNSRLYDPVATNPPLAMDGLGNLMRWNDTRRQWDTAMKPKPEGPAEAEMALAFVVWLDRLKEEPYRLPPTIDGQGHAYVGLNFLLDPMTRNHQTFYFAESADRPFEPFGKFPRDAIAMFPSQQGIVVVNRSGEFFQLDSAQLAEAKGPVDSSAAPDEATDIETPSSNDLASDSPPASQELSAGTSSDTAPDAEMLVTPLGPDNRIGVSETTSVAMNASNQEIAIHKYEDKVHRIHVFRRAGDQYVQERSVQFDIGTESRMRCFVEYQGDTILVVAGNGQVITFDAKTLNEKQGYLPETRFGIESLAGSPDGRWFGLLYTNQRLWLLDTQNDQSMSRPGVTGQGAISAITFDSENQLAVIDRQDRMTVYNPESLSVSDRYSAKGGFIANLYRYAVQPLYRVFPKPGEFYKVVGHLSSTRDAKDNQSVDLTNEKAVSDPFAPLWSGLGFMVFMLGLSCWVFQLKDY